MKHVPEIVINNAITIPADCVRMTASRSGGPGGQNVNKLNTRVTLIVDIPHCPTLSDEQKQRIAARLAAYADSDGCLQISSQRHRSQHANRLDAIERLATLIGRAIIPPVKRRKTRIPDAAIQRRLDSKKHRSTLKKLRSSDIQ